MSPSENRARPATHDSKRSAAEPALRLSRGWRWASYLGAILVLALVFQAHLSPEIAVLWDTFLTLCGVR